MSQITISHLIISMVLALVLGGCGDKNSQAVLFTAESGHPSDWALTHKSSAKANLDSCVECHGTNLDGGVAKSACTRCHPASPDTVSKHPVAWGNFAYARHKSYSTAQRTASCANAACHGVTLAGAGTAPNCATTCHLGGTYRKHPATWTQFSSHKNYVKAHANDSSSCKSVRCHGTDGKGVFLSGPACDECHSMK